MSKKAEKILELIGLDKNNLTKIVFQPKHYNALLKKVYSIILEKEEVEEEKELVVEEVTEVKTKKAKK